MRSVALPGFRRDHGLRPRVMGAKRNFLHAGGLISRLMIQRNPSAPTTGQQCQRRFHRNGRLQSRGNVHKRTYQKKCNLDVAVLARVSTNSLECL